MPTQISPVRRNLGARRARLRRPTSAAALACVTLALAACGSSASTGGGDGGSSGSMAAAVQSARATVAKYEVAQPPITIPALPSKPPAGLTLDLISCPLPSCQATASAVGEAAQTLGWKLKTITAQFTPESYISAFNQALSDNPKLLAFIGVLPNATVQSQLQTAKDRGIKVVGLSPGDASGPLMPGAYSGSNVKVKAGELLADIVVADAGKPVGTLFVRDPTADGLFKPQLDEYKATLTRLCPDCTTTDLEISSNNVGRTVPGQIVSKLQQDPTIRYVVVPADDFFPGAYAALQSAGLADKVKLVGQIPQKQSLAALRSGQQFASIGLENTTAAWRAVDGLARLYMGVPLTDTRPVGWIQIFTKTNVPAERDLTPQGIPKVPGDPSAFLTAWHVS
ncbi:substrate-binding domain-containing protein [Spirillospora sp. CA-255316]